MTLYYKLGDFKEFLISLMKNNIVDAVVVPMRGLTENSFSPFLIKDIELLKNCEPQSPIMSINSARALSQLTAKGAIPFKVAAVMKPCEVIAFRELIKLNQVNPENIITISFDCNGVNSLKDINSKREICEICTGFTPDYADIKIFSIGIESPVIATDIELSSLNLEQVEYNKESRENFIKEKLDENIKKRENKLLEIKSNFQNLLKNCIVCKNCMRVCPICFCQECFFDSPALSGNSVTYTLRANRMSGLSFPENKLLFHLGRMNHMSVSCVGCGACEDACPAEIPVSQMFASAGDELKKLFNYQPGRDIAEKIPFTCYEHDELHSFEQPYLEKR